MFTKEESRTILECVRFDIVQSSVGSLLETTNLQLIMSDPKLMLESYFSDTMFYISEADVKEVVSKIAKGFIYAIKTLAQIGTILGLKSLFKMILNSTNQFAGNIAKWTSQIMLKHGATTSQTATGSIYTSKAATILGALLSKFSTGFIACAKAIGISAGTAHAMVPMAAVLATMVGAMIAFKIVKIILAGLKRMVALFKSGKKEEIEKTSENLASASIKMQEQAISKIEDPKKKQMVIEQLNKKKAKLKK